MKHISLCCVAWLFTLITAFAQVDTGAIAGSVRDTSGAGLASASVTFVDVAGKALLTEMSALDAQFFACDCQMKAILAEIRHTSNESL